jgi:hypothetical protein
VKDSRKMMFVIVLLYSLCREPNRVPENGFSRDDACVDRVYSIIDSERISLVEFLPGGTFL